MVSFFFFIHIWKMIFYICEKNLSHLVIMIKFFILAYEKMMVCHLNNQQLTFKKNNIVIRKKL